VQFLGLEDVITNQVVFIIGLNYRSDRLNAALFYSPLLFPEEGEQLTEKKFDMVY
jgi:hypothetical protein